MIELPERVTFKAVFLVNLKEFFVSVHRFLAIFVNIIIDES